MFSPPRPLQGTSGQKKLFNTWFRDEVGASPSWLFVAPTDKTPNGKAIVKVACIPVGKHARHKFATCYPDLALKYAKVYLAIEKLAEDCGLTGEVEGVKGGGGVGVNGGVAWAGFIRPRANLVA